MPPRAPGVHGQRGAPVVKTAALLLSLFVLLLSGCDSCLPQSFRATPKAGFERMAVEVHRICVQDNPCYFVSTRHRQSEARCLDAGYAKECGNGELEGSCGVGVK